MRDRNIIPYMSIPLMGMAVLFTRDVIESTGRYIDNAPLLLFSALCVIAAVLVWQHPFVNTLNSTRGKWRLIARSCTVSLLCMAAVVAQEIAYINVEKTWGQLSVNLLRVFLALICSVICVRIAGNRGIRPLNALMGILGLPGVILVTSGGSRNAEDSQSSTPRR